MKKKLMRKSERVAASKMEFQMRAMEDLEIGTDITPPLSPLSFSLHSHSSAFRSDLHTALRLLLHHRPDASGRVAGLLSNCHKLTSHSPHHNDHDEVSQRILVDAEAMAAEILKDRGDQIPYNVVLEEAMVALCVVLTNAVEVQEMEESESVMEKKIGELSRDSIRDTIKNETGESKLGTKDANGESVREKVGKIEYEETSDIDQNAGADIPQNIGDRTQDKESVIQQMEESHGVMEMVEWGVSEFRHDA